MLAGLKDLDEVVVRNGIQLLDGLSLDIGLTGRPKDIDQPCTPKILRNQFADQADLGQQTGKFSGRTWIRRLTPNDKLA